MQPTDTQPLPGLAHALVVSHVLSAEHAYQYHQAALLQQQSFLDYVIEQQLLEPAPIALACSQVFGVPYVDLTAVDVEQLPLSIIKESMQQQLLALQLRDKQLWVALTDPSQTELLRELHWQTGFTIHAVVARHDHLLALLEKISQANNPLHLLETTIEPIVKFVQKIIEDAITRGVSDIHFEPYDEEYRIRYRQDGILIVIATPAVSLAAQITARIKILANLDIAEKRLPQDGHFKLAIHNRRSIDCRVSTCPTVAGEKVVIRVLDHSNLKRGMDTLGFTPPQQALFLQSLAQPQGMIIVTGPTGSGKTVTLYSALALLNQVSRNIATVEDPVEIKLAGINQVAIHPKAGLTFATTLRALLRQDPDVIMVGEMRDPETADIAIKAAQTGHLVLSTLHTNNAASCFTRLLDLGVPAYHIASAVTLVIAQRLVRQCCQQHTHHCEHCQQGYKGRCGIFEVMPVTDALRELIVQHASVAAIEACAKKHGMLTLMDIAQQKIAEQITDLAEVNRVIME